MSDVSQQRTRQRGAAFDCTKRLTLCPSWSDTGPVPEKEGTRLGRLNTQSALTAQCGFFTCVCLCTSPMSGGGREALGLAGFFGYQSTNPATCRSPRLVAGHGVTLPKEAHMPGINPSLHSPFRKVRHLTAVRLRAAIVGEVA